MTASLRRGIDEMLAEASARLGCLDAREAHDALRAGAVLVDIRPQINRDLEGGLPGASSSSAMSSTGGSIQLVTHACRSPATTSSVATGPGAPLAYPSPDPPNPSTRNAPAREANRDRRDAGVGAASHRPENITTSWPTSSRDSSVEDRGFGSATSSTKRPVHRLGAAVRTAVGSWWR